MAPLSLHFSEPPLNHQELDMSPFWDQMPPHHALIFPRGTRLIVQHPFPLRGFQALLHFIPVSDQVRPELRAVWPTKITRVGRSKYEEYQKVSSKVRTIRTFHLFCIVRHLPRSWEERKETHWLDQKICVNWNDVKNNVSKFVSII